MRICLVSNAPEEEAGDRDRFLREEYFPKVTRPDTKVDIKYEVPGIAETSDVSYLYFRFLHKRGVIEKAIEAEKEGYDAIAIGCFTEPGLQEAREILNIPVIGPAEASMLLACQLGAKFGIVTPPIPRLNLIFEAAIKLYGLEERAIVNPVKTFSLSETDLFVNCLKDPQLIKQDLIARSEELVQCGAEVVIIGCCDMGPVATIANVVKVGEKDIPILDCLAVALKTAEMMVDLRNMGIPVTSRACSHIQPSEEHLKRVRAEFGLDKG